MWVGIVVICYYIVPSNVDVDFEMRRVHMIFNLLLKLIFPPRCIFCKGLLDIRSEIDICESCYKGLPFAANRLADLLMEDSNNRYYDDVVCVFEYSGAVKASLKRYKFNNKAGYSRVYAELLYREINRRMDVESIDMVMSVPRHIKKELMRGYNQSKLISEAISRKIGIPECSHLIKRTRFTESQSSLDKKDRYGNIKDAFKLVSFNELMGKKILIIDDIITTGLTLSECARLLKTAGAQKVISGVVASGKIY